MVKVLSVDAAPETSLDRVVDLIPDIVNKITSVLEERKTKKQEAGVIIRPHPAILRRKLGTWRRIRVRKQLAALGVLCALPPGLVLHTQAAQAPAVSAASAVLMDGETGRVLYAKDENTPPGHRQHHETHDRPWWRRSTWGRPLPPGGDPEGMDGDRGTSLYLVPGETLSLKTLFYGLLLPSGERRGGGPGLCLRRGCGHLRGLDEPAGPGFGDDPHPLLRPQRSGG